MADSIRLNNASGGPTLRTDENADKEHSVYLKTADGTADSDTVIAAGNGIDDNSLRVTLASDGTGLVKLAASTATAGEVTIGEASVGQGDLAKAEDAAFQDGSSGIQLLGVRNDTPANLSGTDGDYEPLQVSAGRLWASVAGNAADDAAASGNPVLVGGVAVDIDGSDPTSVAEGDMAQLRTDGAGRLLVSNGGADTWKATDNQSTAQTNTELVAPASGNSLVLTGFKLSSAGTQTVKLVRNTASPTDIIEPFYLAANSNVAVKLKTPLVIYDGENIGYTSTAAVAHSITATGFEIPEVTNPVDPFAAIKTGLVAWYDFESDLTDSHSGGLDLTLTTGTMAYASGLNGNAADVNVEQADVAVSATGFAGSGSFTFAGWVNSDTDPGVDQYIARRGTKNGSSGTLDWVLVLTTGGTARFGCFNTGRSITNVNSAASAWATSTWVFLCAQYDSATGDMTLTIDNDTPATGNLGGTLDTQGADFGVFGLSTAIVARNFKGLCDSYGYWNRVLTTAEVSGLYNSGSALAYSDLP